jgi:addiction module HigA family antidote
MTEQFRLNPTWSVKPGEVLTEALEERGMTQTQLASRMARPLKTISEITNGKTAITADTAIQLERALGISAAVWLALESQYREAQARLRDQVELESAVAWLERFPIKELVRRKVLSRGKSSAEKAAQLLAYFAVSNPNGWEQHWGQLVANYRTSGRGIIDSPTIAVWLREAERVAEGVMLPEYRDSHLEGTVRKLRPLTRELVVGGALARARELLNECGVGMALVEGMPGIPVSAALHWIKGNPWIVLTLRYGTDDQLWFSLFHEIGHLLKGGRRLEVVEAVGEGSEDTDYEEAANSFARDTLIPHVEFEAWLSDSDLSVASISAFAASQDISPAIVVGRLQRDRVLAPSELNRLKRPLARIC